jgi:hypothetical protein
MITNLIQFYFYFFYLLLEHMQPISQWSSANVGEWMAALNLYRYAELFRSKDIKGVDLLSLDKDKLTVISFFFSFLLLFLFSSLSWRKMDAFIECVEIGGFIGRRLS